IFSATKNKLVEITVIPSRLKNYQLVQYYRKLEQKRLITLIEIKHFLLTQNEMVKRGLKDGVIETLNDTTEEYGF
ncbi:MAG: hypothetical protein KAJ49_07270, partial [Arcobacteraceae bacterium]|nr:hypothetical protein [Arcobacteraceae bacterium]